MLRFLVLRHVNKVGFRTEVTFLVPSNCSCHDKQGNVMASAILYCEVCHQNVALNDNFCSHCGMQLLCIMLEFLHRFHSVSMWLRTLKKSLRDVTRTLIGGGGGLFIYSRSARRISFEFDRSTKK